MQFNTYDAIHFPFSEFYLLHFPLIHLIEQDKTEARGIPDLAVQIYHCLLQRKSSFVFISSLLCLKNSRKDPIKIGHFQ